MSNGVDRLLTSVLVLCALVVTALVVRREFMPTPPTTVRTPRALADVVGPSDALAVKSAPTARLIGPATAPVQLVEFADFQCPACAGAATELKSLQKAFPGRFVLIFRHMPLSSHPFARQGASAAECAGAQGVFDQFYYVVFEQQARIGVIPWREFARLAGVRNLVDFDQCLKSDRFGDRISKDMELANTIQLTGTPTWIFMDTIYTGAPPAGVLARWIRPDSMEIQRK